MNRRRGLSRNELLLRGMQGMHRRTAARVLYLIKQLDWYNVSEWPQWAVNAVVRDEPNNRDRFRLFQFFTANGMGPEQAADFLLNVAEAHTGVVRRKVVRHMLQMQHQVNTGSFDYRGRIYNMHQRRPV